MKKLRRFMVCALVYSLLLPCGAALARPVAEPATPAATPSEPATPVTAATSATPVTPAVPDKKERIDILGEPRTAPLTAFERQIIEQGFRLLPYDHPFVTAYARTYKVNIKSFITEINGVKLSGVPFEFGGSGNFDGFSDKWWTRTGQGYYPIRGLDCANFITWIYRQAGVNVPSGSAALFFGGKSGVLREVPGLRAHYVIPTLGEAMIGDIFYNSQKGNYQSGDGSHTQMYIGSADILGISEELRRMIPKFPCDAHLVLDCGWSDGPYYYKLMQALDVPNPRKGMGGVGVQFMTSIQSGDEVLYASPAKTRRWVNPENGNTYQIDSRLEINKRLLQYAPAVYVKHPMNLVRPVSRPDVAY